jgi:glycosyltransferase involved in cell wall biosynthesis
MRAGLPVLATGVGGIPEAVVDSSTGLLAAPGDDVQLAAHLERLVSDPALRKRLGENGRRRFLEQFTFDQMLTGTLEVYREATQTAAPVARPQTQT